MKKRDTILGQDRIIIKKNNLNFQFNTMGLSVKSLINDW